MKPIIFKIIPHKSLEYYKAVALREKILRSPLGLTFLPEELEQEQSHIQIVGMSGDEIISTAVLVPEGKNYKMQRVVVTQEQRGEGVGTNMMEFCEQYAEDGGYSSIYCHARDTAVNFYLKNGYVPEGDYFVEDTIPHLKMIKELHYKILPSQ